MDARVVRAGGRFPWELLVLLAWFAFAVGGVIVTLWALVLYFSTPTSTAATAPVGVSAELGVCRQPELVIVLEDNSASVVDLDPGDQRLDAVQSLVDLLVEQPCTDDDVVSVVSFTDRQAITGPAPAGRLGSIGRAGGDSTDIGAAVAEALAIVDGYPDHRPVIILLSDLEERSPVPLDETLQRLEQFGVELILVSIGDGDQRPGITQLVLRDASSISGDLIDAINVSRSQT